MADVSVNRMSILRQREQHQAQFDKDVKEVLTFDIPLVVHRDGKLMEDLTTKTHIDRLPVIVSGKGIC